MKFSRQLVSVGSSLAVLVLTACSSSPVERHQAEDNFTYLNTKVSQPLRLPQGAKPQFYQNYNLPIGDFSGKMGKDVDVRAPVEVLELLSGMRTESKPGEIDLWFVRPELAEQVWNEALGLVRTHNGRIRQQSATSVETNDLTWEPLDEETPLLARYRIEKVQQDQRSGVRFKILSLTQSGQSELANKPLVDRYTALMVNRVTSQLETRLRRAAEAKAKQSKEQIAIQMGTDRSGLPVVIARGDYDFVWERLSGVLPDLGFTINDSSRSEGSIEVKYQSPDIETWQQLGVEPLTISAGTYTLMLGDLENRTSINVTDGKGKPISEEALRKFAPVLSASFSKHN